MLFRPRTVLSLFLLIIVQLAAAAAAAARDFSHIANRRLHHQQRGAVVKATRAANYHKAVAAKAVAAKAVADKAVAAAKANNVRRVQQEQDQQEEGPGGGDTTTTTAENGDTETETTVAEQQDKNGGVFAFPYENYKLPSNDLQVVIVPLGDDFPGIVSAHMTVQAGSRNELEEGKTGMAHFFEHMMFRGTSNITSEQFDSTYSELGATYNAWTWNDMTNYYATFPKTSASGESNLDTIMLYESDRFKHINYTTEDFKTEAGAILGEYNTRADKIWNKLSEVRSNISFSVHPYKHSVMGTIEDIRDMPNELEYSRLFFERFYKPENCILMIFGDVDVDETKTIVDKYWSDWAKGNNYVSDVPQEPLRDTGAVYEHVQWPEASTPWLSISFNAANFLITEPDTAALDIIQFMVFSSASPLYEKLVTKDQSAISLDAAYYWFKDPYTFTIEANVASIDELWTVRDEILKALSKLRTETVSEVELDRVKSALKYSAAMAFDSTDAIADDMQMFIALTGNPDSINQLYALYDTITPETIMEVAKKYFTDNRLATITLAFAEETLPDPPAAAESSEYNALAGSIDSIVKAAEDQEVFNIDQVILPSESSKLVDFDIRFRVGAVDDPEGKQGLASLTTKMIADAGSESFTLQQIRDMLFPMSASFSGSTGKEYTYFSGKIHVDNLDRYFDIVSEMLLSPGFREEDFERIKTETKRAIQDAVFDDSTVASRAFDAVVFEDHPYEHLGSGTIASLDSITMDDVKSFYTDKFTKQNAILGLAGGASEKFVQKVKNGLLQLPDGPIDKELLTAPPAKLTSNAIIIEQAATKATTIRFGYSLPKGMSRGHPDYAALRVAQNHYGDGSFSSTLMSEIRVKRGLNYGDSASLRYGGLALQGRIKAVDSNEIAHFATRLAMFELNKLLTNGLTEEEFQFNRDKYFNVLPVLVDTPASVLSLAMEGLELGYGEDYLGYMQGQLSNLTLDAVNTALRNWLKDGNVTFVFVTPDAADMRDRLVNATTSVVVYKTEEVPEGVPENDEIIKDYPLGLSPNNIEIMSATDLFPGTEAGLLDIDDGIISPNGETVEDSMKGDDLEGSGEVSTTASTSGVCSLFSFSSYSGGGGMFVLSLAMAMLL